LPGLKQRASKQLEAFLLDNGIASMDCFRMLPGLPATGPWPEQFSANGRGTHREGFVVEFLPEMAPAWVGNFQRGLTIYCRRCRGPSLSARDKSAEADCGFRRPNRQSLRCSCVQLGDLQQRPLAGSLGLHCEAVADPEVLLSGVWDLYVNENTLTGHAWDAINERGERFSVDLNTGDVTGGAYEVPDEGSS